MIVASFFAPRPPQSGVAWSGTDYDALCRLLDASCRKFGLRHVVISDRARPEPLTTFRCDLPENLMLALLDGQRQFLAATREPVLLVGADCLLTRDPRPYFLDDIAVTIGPFSDCPMNTGAIFCADGPTCAPIWAAALARQPKEWGDDQRALYAAVKESGLAVAELACRDHNWAPEAVGDDAGLPTVVHFRGRRKAWMADWAARHLGLAA